MAIIDFPASPVDGQTFAAPNGVTYVWRATPAPGLWIAQAGGTSPGGDFSAWVGGSGQALPAGTNTIVLFPNILTGNLGSHFNVANGRYTPPAGRFLLAAQVYQNGANNTATGQFYKNGVAIGAIGAGFNAAGSQTVAVTLIVDANGSDVFDFRVNGNNAATVNAGLFSATPTSGVKGPPGDVGSPGGDFFVQGSGALWAPSAINTWETANPGTLVTGNAGGWYNTTTGVFLPPAGRFRLYGQLSFNSSSSNMLGQLRWRKNGATIPNTDTVQNTAGAGFWGSVTAEVMVDANGTDTFDLQVQCNVLMSNAYGYMGAFPISGIRGLPGPPGVIGNGWRLIERKVVSGAVPTLDFTGIPSDINDLELRLDLTPVTNAVGMVLQWYDGASTLLTAGYGFTVSASQNNLTSGAAPLCTNNTTSGFSAGCILSDSRATRTVGNVSGIRARATINDIRDAARSKSVDYTATYVSDDAVCLLNIAGGGWRGAATALSGLRLSFGVGNIASGTASLWGSP